MSNRIEITGNITEPESRYTPQNTQILEFRINAQQSKYNKDTSQWENIGAPLWVSVPLWDRDAARWQPHLAKGTRVTVEGVLVVDEFTKRDGTEGIGYSLRNARMKGIVPRTEPAVESPQTGYGTPTTQAPMGGAVNDPWTAAPNNQFNEPAPF